MRKLTPVVAALIAFTTSAYADGEITRSDVDAVMAEMKLKLRDPESARYQWSRGNDSTCNSIPWDGSGEGPKCRSVSVMINAKNGFGGYTGFHYFVFEIKDGRVLKSYDFGPTP